MDGVLVPRSSLVADSEEAADDVVVTFGEDQRTEDGADSVVYAKTGFVPGVNGEEYGVVGE